MIGAGAWGTALANAAARAGRESRCGRAIPRSVAALTATRESPRLPGIRLDERVAATGALADMRRGRTPSCWWCRRRHLRAAATALAPHLGTGTPVIACAKGIERGTHKFMTEIIAETMPAARAGDPVRPELRAPTWRAACRPP